MMKSILECHDMYTPKLRPDAGAGAAFLFTLSPFADRARGRRPTPSETSWTEVFLEREIAESEAWRTLSKRELRRALYLTAVERIRRLGRLPREIFLASLPGDPSASPPIVPAGMVFPRPAPVVIEAPEAAEEDFSRTRAAAKL